MERAGLIAVLFRYAAARLLNQRRGAAGV